MPCFYILFSAGFQMKLLRHEKEPPYEIDQCMRDGGNSDLPCPDPNPAVN
jgi:hypothetical protein